LVSGHHFNTFSLPSRRNRLRNEKVLK